MAIHVELEAKFRQKLIQESKDEPTKLATKLLLVLQHMKITGKENSRPFQIMSRTMETIINQHGFEMAIHVELEAAKSLQKLIQEQDEPTKLATKLLLICQDMKIAGKKNSLDFQIMSRTMEAIINQHGFDIEGLRAKAASKLLDNEGAMSASFVNEKSQKTESARDNVSADSAFRIAPQTIGMLQQDSSSSQKSGLERLSRSEIFDIPQSIASSSRWNNSAVALTSSPKEAVDTDVGGRSPTMIEFPITGIRQSDIVQAETNVDDRSPSRIQSLIQGVEQPNSASQQQPMCGSETLLLNSNDSGNESSIKRLDRDHGITREILLQHSGKKLNEVVKLLGVSRSTLKRICRKQGIHRWWFPKVKNDVSSTLPQELAQPAEEIMEDSCLNKFPLPEQPDTMQNATTDQNDSSIIVKVTYKDDTIKFQLSVSSGKMDLEEEVAKRFHLSIGSFSTKYLDEDDDWISVTCDADLKTCISILKSLGRNTVKMEVNVLQVD